MAARRTDRAPHRATGDADRYGKPAARVCESPDWPTVFHPPGVIRLVTPAEEAALDRQGSAAAEPAAPAGAGLHLLPAP